MNICFEKDGVIICRYDIMSTKEKQATPKAAFVFLVPLELSLIHISEPTRRTIPSRMPSSA